MTTPILTTKLYIPPLPPKGVLRPRLVERLNSGLHRNRKLTLIAAPAGFGKTTLVSEWLAGCAWSATWLSLDEEDSDPTRFLTYLVAALRKIAPNIGEGVISGLQSSQPPPVKTLLTFLLNEIATIPDSFILVLDDYHHIDSKAVDEALTFLVEHLPPQMHLVITTREDPQLPLPRLRVRSQLTELRASDLRFTTAEAAGFFQGMGLHLSTENVAALEDRTEGWIAGLQLAALSMQGQQDVAGFIHSFAGDHRYILDYLVEEVLQRQPEPARRFLLQTSILDRLNGPLCEAVTRQENGQAYLEALERGNFFIVPLDDKRQWYRYHHLFSEVLYTYLKGEQPEQVTTLHRRASEWYEHNGLVAEAIRHTLAAGDFERAADLVELALPQMRRDRQVATLLGWLKALPDEVVHHRPVLNANYGGVLLANGELADIEPRLLDAERWLNLTSAGIYEQSPLPAANSGSEQSPKMIVVDEEAFRQLPGSIAVWRAGLALMSGDLPGTVKNARRALELVSEDDHLLHGGAVALLGLASWVSGDLAEAHRSFADGMAGVQKAGFIPDTINGTIALADIEIAQGRLHQAMRTYKQALQLASTENPEGNRPVPWGTADLYVGMSELYRERNDLNTALDYLLQSKELGERNGFAPTRSRWCIATAKIRQVQGDLDGALELLHEARQVYVSDFFPNVRPAAALITRVWIAQGRLDEAFGWARERKLSADDDLSYLREYEHITLARAFLARARDRAKSERGDHSLGEAKDLLARLLHAAQESRRTGSSIEILVLQALTHQAQGDTRVALAPLEQALTLAEPEGYIRIFVDEGSPMAQLLQEIARQKPGLAPGYVRRLLSVLSEGKAGEATLAKQALIEPLSERELQVLRLLGSDLSGPEIARQLAVSLNTLNTHTKNIYTKLEVNNRRAAIHRAGELHLL